MKRSATTMAALSLAMLGGCGGEDREAKTPIPMGQVPAVVAEAARKALPDVAFDSAYKEKVSGQDAFELKGKDKKGKTREVEVARDGKVLGTE